MTISNTKSPNIISTTWEYKTSGHYRSDALLVFYVWFLSSWSMGVLLFIAPLIIVRRTLLKSWIRWVDWRTLKALKQYKNQFSGCIFKEVNLSDAVSVEAMNALFNVSYRLKRKELPRVFFVDEQNSNSISPGAFTTFFFVGAAPVIICPERIEDLTPYQRFIMYHELGHAAGFHTNHSLRAVLSVTNSVLILWMACVAGFDHYWGLFATGIYLSLSIVDYLDKPSAESAESYADTWGRWGLSAEKFTSDEVNEVLRLRNIHLHRSGGGAAAELRKTVVSNVEYKNEVMNKELMESLKSYQDAVDSEKPIRVHYTIGNATIDGLYSAACLQESDDPSKWNQVKRKISVVNGIIGSFFIGLSFETITLFTTLIALGMSLIMVFFLEVVTPDQITSDKVLNSLIEDEND